MTDEKNNTGYRNTGDWNSGSWNSGDWNTGYRNTGYRNTGNLNTGNLNTGDWNTGDRNTGCFNTITPETGYYFNNLVKTADWDNAEKPGFIYRPSPITWVANSEMTDAEKVENPTFHTTGGYLRKNNMAEEWAKAWAGASDADKELLYALPGFDADVFKEITGIDVGARSETCAGKIVEIDGVKYELKEVKE